MRESIGTTTMFQIIIGFTLLFAAFLAVAITYNRVFRLKNETLGIIEKYEGVNKKSIRIVNNYLTNGGYSTKGNCEVGEYGVKDLNKIEYEKVINKNQKYYYCLNNYEQKNVNGDQIFYKIKMFFKFNIPFIGELTTFTIKGDTKGIKLWDESQKLNEKGVLI